jgi:hypothetical protein
MIIFSKLYIKCSFSSSHFYKNLQFLIYNTENLYLTVKSLNIIKSKEDLIYDLIFSERKEFNIDISDYIEDIYQYADFVNEIKIILKKSKVKIIQSVVNLDSKTAIWYLKVNK